MKLKFILPAILLVAGSSLQAQGTTAAAPAGNTTPEPSQVQPANSSSNSPDATAPSNVTGPAATRVPAPAENSTPAADSLPAAGSTQALSVVPASNSAVDSATTPKDSAGAPAVPIPTADESSAMSSTAMAGDSSAITQGEIPSDSATAERATAEMAPAETAPADTTPIDTLPQIIVPIPEPYPDSTELPADSTLDSAKTAPLIEVSATDSVKAMPQDTLPKDSALKNGIAVEAATNKKSAEKSILNALHGNAYNAVGNEAAGNTIAGNMAVPRKMFGVKTAYFEPIDQQAVVSFGERRTYFVGFDNSENLGILTAGMAFDGFGFAVEGSLGKSWEHVHDNGIENNENVTASNSMIGATASLWTSPYDVVINARFFIPADQTYSRNVNGEKEINNWMLDGSAYVSYSGDRIFWTAGIQGGRYSEKTTTRSHSLIGKGQLMTIRTTLTDSSSCVNLKPFVNVGSAVLQAEDAKVYIGVNATLPIAIYDKIKDISDEHAKATAMLSPNIFGEVALSNYFMAFGGAKFDWNVLSYERKVLNNTTEEFRETVSGKTLVNLGGRFQYKRVALEMAFTKEFLQNPFSGFGESDEIVLDLGAFINF